MHSCFDKCIVVLHFLHCIALPFFVSSSLLFFFFLLLCYSIVYFPLFFQICEIMLFSEGFEGAKILAKKMTVLYNLSKEQLSKQFHYDFGLRALKSVLVMAGGLKRQYAKMSEELVLMRCLRDSNMPKFVFEDVPLFTGLINDLFPGKLKEFDGTYI